MILTYTVTRKDYENVIYSDLKKNQKNSKLGCLLIGLSAPLLVFIVLVFSLMLSLTEEMPFNLMAFLPILILLLLLLLAGVFTNKRVLAKLTLRERIKSGGVDLQYFGPHTLEVKDDRLLLRYGSIEGERLYGGISHITQYKDSVAIYLSAVSCDIIPNTAFADAEERSSFISMVQAKMAAAKDIPIAGEAVAESRSEAKYTIDYAWDEQNLIDALVAGNRLIFQTRLAWKPGRIILTLVSLLFLFRGVTMIGETVQYIAEGSDFAGASAQVAVFLLIIGALMQINLIMAFSPWLRAAVTKQLRNGGVQRDMIGNHTMCVYEDKIKSFGRLSSQDINMEQIYCVKRQGGNLHLLLKAKVIIPVPVSAFRSEDELNEVIAFIESKIRRK